MIAAALPWKKHPQRRFCPQTNPLMVVDPCAWPIRCVLVAGLSIASAGAVRAADAWAVPDAPFRAVVHATKQAPSVPENGYGIELPELGQTMPSAADVVLADAKGQLLPVAKVWRGEGQKVLLLAQSLAPGQDYYVYYGGNRPRRAASWTPKVSLVLETRRLASPAKFEEWPALEAAWKKAPDVDGAGFVGAIDHGENPWGDSSDFLSHYSGWLRTDGKHTTLYTLSSDASFVLIGDRMAFGWPGQHNARANVNNLSKKEVDTQPVATQVDYYHAKTGGDPATMVLGWFKDGKPVPIPDASWLHPGGTEVVRIEHAQGWPVPQVDVKFRSYVGWNGLWLYDTECTLRGGVPAGWTAEWTFDDGSKLQGSECERVIPGPAAHSVRVQLVRGKDAIQGLKKIEFTGRPQEANTEHAATRDNYLKLLDAETPALLAPQTLKPYFEFANEFGTDQQIGRIATAWMSKSPDINDPLWLPGQLAHIRSLAQTNPQQALAELHRLDSPSRIKYGKDLGLAELDILVFHFKDPSAVQTGNRLAFENPNTDIARLAKIRIGDLYRLLGKTAQAVEQYQSVQKSAGDETQGRKFAAQDRANSITITDLIEGDYRHEAEEKVRAWEIEHPMAKYDSDLLLIRGRVLMLFGRWQEALQEIESFRQMQPDSPYQIPADFYRAQALFQLGKKDDARKIWGDIATKYPKHELASDSRRLSEQK